MNLQLMADTARWPGRLARWRVGMSGEAYLALDFFRSFCIKCFIPHRRGQKGQKKNKVRTPMKFW